MRIQRWTREGLVYGWACIEPGCHERGSETVHKAKAKESLNQHITECHGRQS